jgi:hypothetical protein
LTDGTAGVFAPGTPGGGKKAVRTFVVNPS